MRWFVLASLVAVLGTIALAFYDWRYLVAFYIVCFITGILYVMYGKIGGPEYGPPDDDQNE